MLPSDPLALWSIAGATAALLLLLLLVRRRLWTPRPPLGVRIVCISDTHGRHRDLKVPDGDVLIHAGDYTHFGKEEDARDFAAWLAEQPHPHKVVVNGNHEQNAPWVAQAPDIFRAHTFLSQGSAVCDCTGQGPGRPRKLVRVYGTRFCWPMAAGAPNPYFDMIQESDQVDILVAHGPAAGCVDGGKGCSALLKCARRLRPRAVISGHIHHAHGVCSRYGIRFVNAANCQQGYTIGWEPVVIDI
eukprot:TRINITY_DN18908_c0_g1_i1.p1 TRINITY_DN18908_c0_g1~~TRINITY_DN18908_c0_g1_i1.p1  ORF type:complete len:244 (+),score=56.62 TRINITY_DN18908_c0_g1_i1:88-819(+)